MIKKNKTAFTLIELSLVITIFVILIAASFWGANKLKSQGLIVTAQALTKSSPVKDIANLELWLDAASKESFIQSEMNGSGVISTWYDINPQSNYQNNATQSTVGFRPTYTTNVINGLPAVFFSSTPSVGMPINNTLNITGNYSAFIVLKTTSGLSGRAFQSQNINWLLGTWNDGSTAYITHYNNSAFVGSLVPKVSNKVYLAEAVRNTISKFYINGVDNTANSALINAPGTFGLGASGANNEPMNGYIAEVIVFSRDLKDSERQDIESYLITKWGIN